MDAYLNYYVNSSIEATVIKGISKYKFFPRSQIKRKNSITNFIKPLRGLGRMSIASIFKTKKSLVDEILTNGPTTIRGLGRNASYYTNLRKAIKESSTNTGKTYNYWRGLRAGA